MQIENASNCCESVPIVSVGIKVNSCGKYCFYSMIYLSIWGTIRYDIKFSLKVNVTFRLSSMSMNNIATSALSVLLFSYFFYSFGPTFLLLFL